MTPEQFWQAATHPSVVIIDVRPGAAYRSGHLPGSLSAPWAPGQWIQAVAGWWQGQQLDGLALVGDGSAVDEAADGLRELGIPVQAVWNQGMGPLEEAGLSVVAVAEVSVTQLAEQRDRWQVIDVREPQEWAHGIIPGALCLPLGQLPARITELDPGTPYAIVCASGNRSLRAGFFLVEKGFQVANVVGGMKAWTAQGLQTALPR